MSATSQGLPKWKTVRPWLPPVMNNATMSSAANDSAVTTVRRQHSDDFEVNHEERSRLYVNVLDVTATAVVLSVLVPSIFENESSQQRLDGNSSSHTNHLASKSPTISVQVNQQPWPHVAHADASSLLDESGELDFEGANHSSEMTIIVYGLEAGRDFEISLDVLNNRFEEDGDTGSDIVENETLPEDASFTSRSTPTHGAAVLENQSESHNNHHHQSTSSLSPNALDCPPPPYSATSIPTPFSTSPQYTSEAHLRSLLKKIRTSSKRTESVLNASISALKKSVEKGMKEDQRARTRIVGLEDAIRRAKEAERDAREVESSKLEEALNDSLKAESAAKIELGVRRGGKPVSLVSSCEKMDAVGNESERERDREIEKEKEKEKEKETEGEANERSKRREGEDEGAEEEEKNDVGVADLARELDSLNKQLDDTNKARIKKEESNLRQLEEELHLIEAELDQITREENNPYHYHPGGASSESLEAYNLPLPAPVSATGGGFNLRWKRNPLPTTAGKLNQPHIAGVQEATTPQDPRYFGRFFRRNGPNMPPNTSFGIESDFAGHQRDSIPYQTSGPAFNNSSSNMSWDSTYQAREPIQSITPMPVRTPFSSFARRRSGQVDAEGKSSQTGKSTISFSTPSVSARPDVHNRATSMPITMTPIAGQGDESSGAGDEELDKRAPVKEKQKELSSSSSSSGSWSRLGTWSQVVGKSGSKIGGSPKP